MTNPLLPPHATWLAARGISSTLAEKFGLFSSIQSFPPSGESDQWVRAKCVAIPYLVDGKVVNHKYRRVDPKQHVMDKGGQRCLFNMEAVRRAAGKALVITEGEWDAMIAQDLGWDACSVPNGTPKKSSDDPASDKRYEYLFEARDDLAKVKSFVIAVDGDEAGMALRADLIALLTPQRCSFVEYPDGCKDLTDVYLANGVEAVSVCLQRAKDVPVSGLYRFSDFPDEPPIEGMKTGIDAIDEMIAIVPGTLTVFTGYANMGKTTVVDTIVAHAVMEGVNCCLASFETKVKPIMLEGLARALIGCPWAEYHRHPLRRQAEETLEEKISIISNALDADMEMDLEEFLDKCRLAVHRHGAKLFILDPWNELEHKRNRDEMLTEYVGRAIRRIKAFAVQYGVAFWVVAHPTKPAKGTNTLPSLYDVSDSAAWSNKADYGIVYHRPDKSVNEATIAIVKVRKGLPGRCDAASVFFDFRSCRIKGVEHAPR